MENTKPHRPFGINVIVAIHIISGAFFIILAALYIVDFERFSSYQLFGDNTDYDLIVFVLNAPNILIGYGLWRLKRWAWVSVMLRAGFQMSLDMVFYLNGGSPYVLMFLSIVVVFYLNLRDVQRIFLEDN